MSSGAGARGVHVVGRCWRCDHAHCDGSCHVRPLNEPRLLRTLSRETLARSIHVDGDPDRLHEEECKLFRHQDLPVPDADLPPPESNTAQERSASPLERLATLNKHIHAASMNVRQASASLSLQQRRVLDGDRMPTMETQTAQRARADQQLLASIDPDTSARVTSLMLYEHSLRQEWFELHTVLVENARHERKVCQHEMQEELAALDRAFTGDGIRKIVRDSDSKDIAHTLALLATRRKRVHRQFIKSNWKCSKPMAAIDELYSLRHAEYQGMRISSDDWLSYEKEPWFAASELKNWKRPAREYDSDDTCSDCSDGSCSDCSDDSQRYFRPREECWEFSHPGCNRCCGQRQDDSEYDQIWEYETDSGDEASYIVPP